MPGRLIRGLPTLLGFLCFPDFRPGPECLANHYLGVEPFWGLTLSHCPRTLRRAARVAELVDALDSESSVRKDVLVRLQSRAPLFIFARKRTADAQADDVDATCAVDYTELMLELCSVNSHVGRL